MPRGRQRSSYPAASACRTALSWCSRRNWGLAAKWALPSPSPSAAANWCSVRRRSPPATSSSCAVGTQQPHSKTGGRRHDARAQQARVVTRQPPFVLRQAKLEEAAGRDVDADGAPPFAGEIVAVDYLGGAEALPDLHRQGGDPLAKK